MISAALDTSTFSTYFCLEDNGKIIIDKTWENKNKASEILNEIVLCIEKYGYTFAHIEHWYVGVGPGSFTGLRVGIAFIEGLCFDNNTQIWGVNSGALFLPNISLKEGLILHDGRRQEIIINEFIYDDNQWQEKQKPYVIEIKKLPDLINSKIFIKTGMNQEKFNILSQSDLANIDFLTPKSCNNFFDKKIIKNKNKNGTLYPIYVRPAVFINQ